MSGCRRVLSVPITDIEVGLLSHALGWPDPLAYIRRGRSRRGRRPRWASPYRNGFVATIGGTTAATWDRLVETGLAKRGQDATHLRDMVAYSVTRRGMAVCRIHLEAHRLAFPLAVQDGAALRDLTQKTAILFDLLARALGWPLTATLAAGGSSAGVKWAKPLRNTWARAGGDRRWERLVESGLAVHISPPSGRPGQLTSWRVTPTGQAVARLHLLATWLDARLPPGRPNVAGETTPVTP